ncbi:hypothetical protein ACMD2_01479 [Ananas comosus]|uniref:Uncharacterized protein n=1 Tax=Ananas comosus TaxID=4615 RepID=A0A199VBW2_ANACO|nr:hypothetical protein ACMD2_01479 [Ananas comosus]
MLSISPNHFFTSHLLSLSLSLSLSLLFSLPSPPRLRRSFRSEREIGVMRRRGKSRRIGNGPSETLEAKEKETIRSEEEAIRIGARGAD